MSLLSSSKVTLVDEVLQNLTKKRIQKWISEKNYQNKI
jgi:hypothetical protein